MEKRKYELGKYAELYDTTEVEGADGTKVIVRNHISYEDKEDMATYMAGHLLMTHDDSCMYLSSQYDKIEKYMIAKYYTDIDVEDEDIGDVVNFLINNDLYDKIEEYIWNDLTEVRRIFDHLEISVTKTYENDKSLAKALRTSFGFLFTGEDITESLARLEANNGTIFKAFEALRATEKKKEENIDNGKLTIGGNVINFAKKE